MTGPQLKTPTLAQFDALALQALTYWNLPDQVPELLSYRENAVYQVLLASGEKAVLRLHRPGYQSLSSLRSEVDWMAYLQKAGLWVPKSYRSNDGHYVVCLEGEQSDFGQFADLISFEDATPIGASATPLAYDDEALVSLYEGLGARMAKMHLLTDDWQKPQDFYRPSWDVEGFFGASPLWGSFWDCPSHGEETRAVYRVLRDRLKDHLQGIALDLDYGLIHADLLRENVMISHGDYCFIDFNDSGYGFRLFDLATTLVQNLHEARYPMIEASLVKGYLSVRPERKEMMQHLPLFILIRALTYVGWMSDRIDMPGAPERLEKFHHRSLALADQLLPQIMPQEERIILPH